MPARATLLALALASPLAAVLPAAVPTALAQPSDDRPVYLVVMRGDVSNVRGLATALAGEHGSAPRFVYENVFKGFAAPLSEQAVAALRRNPNVVSVERDTPVQASPASVAGTAVVPGPAYGAPAATQANAPWGLDRIDQRALPLSTTYTYDTDAASVTAYVVDTGIRTDHADFGGRARVGYDAIGDGRNGIDCHGHGTHVAGSLGGTTYGVAKGVRLVAVRVLDCAGSGMSSGLIAGLDYVAAQTARPAVVNLSLGGPANTTLDASVRTIVARGMTVAVAAGNSNVDACTASPARVAEAITVGATGSGDARASFSNVGTCLDLFAPGEGIVSASHASTSGTATMSGTSMASPHVAGAAALYLAAAPSASPATVASTLTSRATTGVVTNAGTGSPSRLLHTAPGASAPAPTPAPSAITLTAQGRKVSSLVTVSLRWSGTSATLIDVYRNGARVASVPNTGSYSDATGLRGGTFRHRVCASGTTACSNETTVSF